MQHWIIKFMMLLRLLSKSLFLIKNINPSAIRLYGGGSAAHHEKRGKAN